VHPGVQANGNGSAEKGLQAGGFPGIFIFRPAYIYPVEPRRKPNFSYRALRGISPVFRVLFPHQVIRADDLARAMVEVVVRETEGSSGPIFENRDIRAMASSLH
jgi:uncharacterized protein YbjT (DUF2867 family)